MPSLDPRRGLKMAMLPVIVFEMILVVGSTYTDIYNFPMFGVLIYQSGRDTTAYGSVTVVKESLAICASENLFQLDPSFKQFITDSSVRGNLYVLFGTDLMNPPESYENGKLQKSRVNKIYLAKNTEWAGAMSEWEFRKPPNVASFLRKFASSVASPPDRTNNLAELETAGWTMNPFRELQWDIALLHFEAPLRWGPYVLPVSEFTWKSNQLLSVYKTAWNHVEKLELAPHEFVPCSVPGWSPIGNNEIIFHKVVYIRFKECAEAICGRYPSSCLRYLNARHHICFKSLSFADSCVLDQGAPVLCSWYPDNLIGIVVKTFECGTEGLPSVVTRKDAMQVFAGIANIPSSQDIPVPRVDDPLYTENPNL